MKVREAERILKPVAAKAAATNVSCNAIHVNAEAPWEAIIVAAKKQKCDAIVMASHGRRGVTGMLLGSENREVLTHSNIPAIVVR